MFNSIKADYIYDVGYPGVDPRLAEKEVKELLLWAAHAPIPNRDDVLSALSTIESYITDSICDGAIKEFIRQYEAYSNQ